jgi:spermidine/putrescine transport system ATP-binding protein
MAAAGDLACRELRKAWPNGGQGGVRALDGVSLDVASGEFFTLLGPSGCGKTTLLRVIGGFETPDSGSVALGGVPLDGLPPHRRPVNTVFQSYAVFPHMTVAGNVAFPLQMQGRGRAEIAARVEALLALVRLEGFGGRRPEQLSGGQLQRVALARALAGAPKLLLLDEPLSALDLKLRTEMRLELKRLQAETGISFVFVTHDQHEALSLSDRIAVMRAGRVEQVGTPLEVYERPASRFVADFVGEANLLPARRVGPRRFAVAGGELEAAEDGPDGATVVLRPERAVIAQDGEGLAGTVAQVVYDGADLTYHVAMAEGLVVRVRVGSRDGRRFEQGAAVRVSADPQALRVVTS